MEIPSVSATGRAAKPAFAMMSFEDKFVLAITNSYETGANVLELRSEVKGG